ncbi:polysaccharide biosynthesis/export family protein [Sphingomonas nostoxanthinifaciens]|uniref:polysaccharide biosynthesis/export family protein n=1 Tax=Sphingomonas nostoxanthinifaciens TaxID=2872652 RepID=UPI001CC214C9|nr:polysaccharide biosynthesis/export family protein [Sphingomonas nostoxanthinifaciens]UAK24992.1 polysaccharide export protein [Sphingomonas nostoxanthinifaciens]
MLSLSGCATLPASGPTAGEIRSGARRDNAIGFRIVDVDAPTLAEIDRRTAVLDAARPTLTSLAGDRRTDFVGPGDVLTIDIYEVGASLFGSGRDQGNFYDPSAKGEKFPAVLVDHDGAIRLPYVGRLQVAGRTVGDIQDLIEQGLRGKSQHPQVLVGIKQSATDVVYVGGDVRKPGRLDIMLQQQRLLDAIALAGGPANSSEDTIVRFARGDNIVEERLGRIRAGAKDDLVLAPGDRIELIRRPRTFIVLGATSKVSQVSFETGDLSLAEAVARAGGPTDTQADPAAVFLFRYEPVGAGEQPVIYRLNMLRPASYFLAQRLALRDKDVLYIANAASNRPAKLVGIINQLFSPFLTARAIAN